MTLTPAERARWASFEVQELFARLLDLNDVEHASLLHAPRTFLAERFGIREPETADLLARMLSATLERQAGSATQAFCW